MLTSANTLKAQVVASDSVMQHAKGNRLSIGGYGEAALSRMFYSDHVNRYSTPQNYKGVQQMDIAFKKFKEYSNNITLQKDGTVGYE